MTRYKKKFEKIELNIYKIKKNCGNFAKGFGLFDFFINLQPNLHKLLRLIQ